MLRFAEPKESEFLTSQFTKLKLSSRVALGLGIIGSCLKQNICPGLSALVLYARYYQLDLQPRF
jgi:hypothetical protein